MHIICPHCKTSYEVNAAAFGDAGRTVRCSKCSETWLAHPEELETVQAPAPAMAAESGEDSDLSGWGELTPEEQEQTEDTPTVDSPSISSDLPTEEDIQNDWAAQAQDEAGNEASSQGGLRARLQRLFKPLVKLRPRFIPGISLSTACAAMAALVLALMIWRVDVVRLLPQTAAFYKTVGLAVNLRGLAIKDVALKSEIVDGKRVLVVEGVIIDETRKPVEVPRLRFIVRDAQGAEIYAWNARLEQPGLNPGDKAWFRSRLASPPAEGRSIEVRFFNKRDMAAGSS
jgi:predicted Zn finger-like uncharacterized protein